MTRIVKNFADDNPPKDAAEWADELKISQRFFTHVAQKLVDVNLLAEIKTDQHDKRIFIPAMDINTISMHTVYEKLENRGNDEDFNITKNPVLEKIDRECRRLNDITDREIGKVILKDF